ncbi:hypothetical protein C8R46DRAFT_1221454 [Mycena filopes]|nr:hypothetical protein C8R46DRAFT_1221454 [Mycena filopes]
MSLIDPTDLAIRVKTCLDDEQAAASWFASLPVCCQLFSSIVRALKPRRSNTSTRLTAGPVPVLDSAPELPAIPLPAPQAHVALPLVAPDIVMDPMLYDVPMDPVDPAPASSVSNADASPGSPIVPIVDFSSLPFDPDIGSLLGSPIAEWNLRFLPDDVSRPHPIIQLLLLQQKEIARLRGLMESSDRRIPTSPTSDTVDSLLRSSYKAHYYGLELVYEAKAYIADVSVPKESHASANAMVRLVSKLERVFDCLNFEVEELLAHADT